MLKITITETQTEESWILQGRLFGPWVAELKTTWKRRHRRCSGRACWVDLTDVTFIDKGGERLLRSMSKQGVQVVGTGIYIRHLIGQLKTNGKRRLYKHPSA